VITTGGIVILGLFGMSEDKRAISLMLTRRRAYSLLVVVYVFRVSRTEIVDEGREEQRERLIFMATHRLGFGLVN